MINASLDKHVNCSNTVLLQANHVALWYISGYDLYEESEENRENVKVNKPGQVNNKETLSSKKEFEVDIEERLGTENSQVRELEHKETSDEITELDERICKNSVEHLDSRNKFKTTKKYDNQIANTGNENEFMEPEAAMKAAPDEKVNEQTSCELMNKLAITDYCCLETEREHGEKVLETNVCKANTKTELQEHIDQPDYSDTPGKKRLYPNMDKKFVSDENSNSVLPFDGDTKTPSIFPLLPNLDDCEIDQTATAKVMQNTTPKVHFALDLVEPTNPPNSKIIKTPTSSKGMLSQLPKPVEKGKMRRTSSTKDATQLILESVEDFQQTMPTKSRDCPSYEDFAKDLAPASLNEISFAADDRASSCIKQAADNSQLSNLTASQDTEDEPSAWSLPSGNTGDSAVSMSDENMSSLEQVKLELAQGIDETEQDVFGDQNAEDHTELASTSTDGNIDLYTKGSVAGVENVLQSSPGMSIDRSLDDSVLGETLVGTCDLPFFCEDELQKMLDIESLTSVCDERTLFESYSGDQVSSKQAEYSQGREPASGESDIIPGMTDIQENTNSAGLEQSNHESNDDTRLVNLEDQPNASAVTCNQKYSSVRKTTENIKNDCKEIQVAQGKHSQKVYKPNITSLDITGINLGSKKLVRESLHVFCSSNANLEKFFVSWNKFSDEMLQEIAKYSNKLRILSLVIILFLIIYVTS